MTQDERLIWLIKYLLGENPEYGNIKLPEDKNEQFRLYRSLVNIRMPAPVDEEYLKTEDEFLQEMLNQRGIFKFNSLSPVDENVYLRQGDITIIDTDAVVNAANSRMLGCFCPCHGCIDNCIHTFAGVRLRQKCNEIMRIQSHGESTGKAKITPAYNLASKYVIHTVGPNVHGRLTQEHYKELEGCYRSCLELAAENRLESIAFCCISTGEFHFPNEIAAEIAIKTVRKYTQEKRSDIKVVFNVFKKEDYGIYKRLLG